MIQLVEKFKIWIKNPYLIKLAQVLHLQGFLKKMYFLLLAPLNRNKLITIGTYRAIFLLEWFYDLVYLDLFFNSRFGEVIFLKMIIKGLKPGDVFYDIGANIGAYSIIVAKKIGIKGTVVAIEPEKNNFIKLKKNIYINKLTNVLSFCIALGDKKEKRELFIDEKMGYQTCSLIKKNKQILGQITDVFPGDELVIEKNLPLPIAIKIDVEGFEWAVLKGLTKTLSAARCTILCCEVHPSMLPDGITEKRIIDFINKLGFQTIQALQRGSEVLLICNKNASVQD